MALQTGLAQWTADLDAIVEFPPSPALDWNGRVLRLVRRSSLSPSDGVRVVGWTRRDGRWLRRQSPALTTRGDLQAAWEQADLWSQNPSDAMRSQEVPIAALTEWQVFYFRGDSWSNPLSSAGEAANAPQPRVFGSRVVSAPVLPDGVRIVLDLPPGRGISGRLQKDWIRPTVGGGKS
jgi:general secretion pathway protein J